MERDSLQPEAARDLICKAGGTALVAANLGVPFDEVVDWARVGVESVDHAIALVNLAHFGPTRVGRGARCALVTLDELWEAVGRYPSRAAAAQDLGVGERALRRYLSGERVPAPAVAERILAIASDRLSPNANTLALTGHAEPHTATSPDHLP